MLVIMIVYFYSDKDYERDLETKAKLRYASKKDAHIEIEGRIYHCTDLRCRRIKKPFRKVYVPSKRRPDFVFLMGDCLVMNNPDFVSVYEDLSVESYRLLGFKAIGSYKNLLVLSKGHSYPLTYVWDHEAREIVDVYYGSPSYVYDGRVLAVVRKYDVKKFLEVSPDDSSDILRFLHHIQEERVLIDLETRMVERIPKEGIPKRSEFIYTLAYLYGVKDEVEHILDKIIDISPRFAILKDSGYYIYDIKEGEKYPIDSPLYIPRYISGDVGVFVSECAIYVREDGLKPVMREPINPGSVVVSENKIVISSGNIIRIIDPTEKEPLILIKLDVDEESEGDCYVNNGNVEYVLNPLPVKSDSGRSFGIEVLEFEIEFDEELEEVKRTLRDVFMILYYNGRSITIRPYEAVLPFFTGRLFLGAEIKDGRIEVLLCSETRDGIVSVEIDPENPIIREEDLKRARLLYPKCFVDISDLKDPMEVNVRIR